MTGIPLESLWTPVLYTNTFSILPALFVCVVAKEDVWSTEVTPIATFWLAVSCAFGTLPEP